MTKLVTEQSSEYSKYLDTLSSDVILSILHKGQIAAAKSVSNSMREIENAALLLADTINGGGNIIYAAAGSSALMAFADGLELPGTFGIKNERIKILMAGGNASLTNMTGDTEDDCGQAIDDIRLANATPDDCLICLSASGSTPYALSALEAARAAGARTIAIANNPDRPLLMKADISIYLATPPEIISGSTRLGAATAQKICLNMMSTLMAVQLGHIHGGDMVNLQADNTKLKTRAARIVHDIAGCSAEQADAFLDKAQSSVKLAVLLASGAPDLTSAKKILESNGQKLRASLSAIKRAQVQNNTHSITQLRE
ncbi:MAG: N-acetylmuramic acid 6-phosphate etherase [Hyphomicrobiales bacterium]|nr:N-acetylmuramic acid 6-phosphate etherase [Hyphomicrobiales bacterium]